MKPPKQAIAKNCELMQQHAAEIHKVYRISCDAGHTAATIVVVDTEDTGRPASDFCYLFNVGKIGSPRIQVCAVEGSVANMLKQKYAPRAPKPVHGVEFGVLVLANHSATYLNALTADADAAHNTNCN